MTRDDIAMEIDANILGLVDALHCAVRVRAMPHVIVKLWPGKSAAQ